MLDLTGKKLILGSASPRRKEILEGLCADFEVDARNSFQEHYKSGTPPHEIPEILSAGKSHGFHRALEENEILVTADTVVVCGTEVFGKPHSRDEAFSMLQRLSGRTHEVITGVTIRDCHREETFSDTCRVHFAVLDDDEINNYIYRFRPFDKAGAYGIQEWIGYAGIEGISGSFYTVMGLPSHLVYRELKKFVAYR